MKQFGPADYLETIEEEIENYLNSDIKEEKRKTISSEEEFENKSN